MKQLLRVKCGDGFAAMKVSRHVQTIAQVINLAVHCSW